MAKWKIEPGRLAIVTIPDDWAEGGTRSFIGEITSGVAINDAVTINRIPREPLTTLVVPANYLQEPHTKYRYMHLAEVAGSYSFPTDMLRYDRCEPLNFRIETLDGYRRTPIIDARFGFLKPIVVRVSENLYPDWTVGRWSSFNWGVKPIERRKL